MQYLHSRSIFLISRPFISLTKSQFPPLLPNLPTMTHKKYRGSQISPLTSNGVSLLHSDHKKDDSSASVTRKDRPPHQRQTRSWVKKSSTAEFSGEKQMVGSSDGNNRSLSSATSSTETTPPLASSSCQSHDLLQDDQFGSGVGLSELREDEVSTPEHFNNGKPQAKRQVGGSLENQILENSVQDEVTSATRGQIPLLFGTLSNSVEGQQSGSHGEYPQKSNDPLLSSEAAETTGKLKAAQQGARRHNSPQRFRRGMSNPKNASPEKVNASCFRVDVVQSKPERGGSTEHMNIDQSKMGKYQFKKGSPDRGQDNGTPPQFNICLRKHKNTPTASKPSFLQKNKEKREYSKNDPRPTLLRPGMVLLKNFITSNDQIEIIKKCQDLGVGPGGFYQPGYNGGAKLSLRMMCLGKDWDPQTRSYDNIRSIDGAIPPIIPDAFRTLVRDAIQASYSIMSEAGVKNPDKAIPWMDPDICIVNFYTENGKLGLHQDRDETDESIKKGLPVVSFSIGGSAEFLYGDEWDVDKAEKIELKSGDVLIFGGKARRVFHGVTSIKPDSVPKFLLDEVDLRPGRLNLTFRQY